MSQPILDGLPTTAPASPTTKLRFADVAVTATAKEFNGIYRNKQQHAPDFNSVLDRALKYGVEKVLLTGMSLHDVSTNLSIAQTRPSQCFITIGVHPYHAAEIAAEGPEYLQKMGDTISKLLEQKPSPVAAFGELGLDWDHLEWAGKEMQIEAFKGQLDLFVEKGFDLPLFLHCRAAFEDFVEVLTPYLEKLPRGGLVHSFVGTREEMKKLVEMGLQVSVNGFSFKDNEGLMMVRDIPLDRLQIETDAPWGEIQPSSEIAKTYLHNARPMPPSKKKDKFELGAMVKTRNESCMIDRVALVVAGVKGISVDEVAKCAWRNSVKMFGLGVDQSGLEQEL